MVATKALPAYLPYFAFGMLLAKFPKLALAGQPQWQTDPYLRAVTNLPLQF